MANPVDVITRCAIAAILFASAAAKLFLPDLEGFGALAPTLRYIVSAVELAFVVWYALPFARSARTIATVFLFSIFIGHSLQALVRNEPTCGCFGAIRVHPAFSLAINVAVIGASFTPQALSQRAVPATSAWTVVLAFGGACCSFFAFGEVSGDDSTSGKYVINLDNKSALMGKEIHLAMCLRDGGAGDSLTNTCRVVVFSPDCASCQETLLAHGEVWKNDGALFVCIESVSGSSDSSSLRVDQFLADISRAGQLRLLDSKCLVFGRLPVILDLDNGIVVGASSPDFH